MGVAFTFVVVEYCTQSHLSTEDYASAMQGLKRTRRFKKYTAWLRDVPDYIIDITKRLWSYVWRRNIRHIDNSNEGRHGHGGRRSLLWTWATNHKRGRRINSGFIEGVPLHRQGSGSPQGELRTMESAPKVAEMAPYMSPVEPEGAFPADLPMQPVEIPLEEGRWRSSYRH